ncbi:MAG TPA: NAD-dependent deacylase [Flavobacteriales bacterium]|nr:NAD-dependent protein deacylase [Flavobacteriales bacterium]HRE73433.1 NAD-dependent deacylase [Flavobacteriales bacterium]HRE96712.1 NAD-dependent deacylase [Flavobacteriales bacterium]HRJ34336.1 NAD-dependent deacylase [Flavobacteriales bacterium]HRJ38882.1 NAD-dependent deacylase [Flavobacteriales bacterium]
MKKKKLVVFSGAGISAESGLRTFRDSDGLWEEYNVMDVATPEAWVKDQELVLEFYNKRRAQILEAKPNLAHISLVELEKAYDVTVITQNIDDLHERAGSRHVVHLHGNIRYARSTNPKDQHLYPISGDNLNFGDKCPAGFQLRPHVVWFGEEVPLLPVAQKIVEGADVLIITGTSLTVYPAANLVRYAGFRCKKFLVDPHTIHLNDIDGLEIIKEKASSGIPKLAQQLLLEPVG